MDKKRITELVRLLPVEAAIFSPDRRPGTAAPRFAECLASALNDPAFGYKFVAEYVGRGESLPAAVYEPWLRQAYFYYNGTDAPPHPVIVGVEQLVQPACESSRNILNALLVCRDIAYEKIAECLGLDEEVVCVYEQLHFNVRDRADDKTYIARLVFPDGRFGSLKPDGTEAMSVATRLLMAGHLSGADEVLWLAGLNTAQKSPPSAEQALKNFEGALLENAVQLARSGALNSKSAPGIAHGKSLLVAKRSREAANSPAPFDPTTDYMSVGKSILLSMPKSQAEADEEMAAAKARLQKKMAKLREEGVKFGEESE